jgi:hypothetical protein
VAALDGLGLEGDVFVIGGAEIYGLLLERCESVYLTVLAGPAEGDAFMPVFEEAFPVVEVIEAQAGVAEWRSGGVEEWRSGGVAAVQEGVIGRLGGGNGLESPFYGCGACRRWVVVTVFVWT